MDVKATKWYIDGWGGGGEGTLSTTVNVGGGTGVGSCGVGSRNQ